jgi:hypothetical protein
MGAFRERGSGEGEGGTLESQMDKGQETQCVQNEESPGNLVRSGRKRIAVSLGKVGSEKRVLCPGP